MVPYSFRLAVAAASAACIVAACGGSDRGPGGPTGPTSLTSGLPSGALRFTASPIAQSAIRWISPLGNLNPPSHTLPTDHIYFYFADPDAGESFVAKRTAFMAPGDGTVGTLLGGVGTESKIYIRQTNTFTYSIDHLILTAPLTMGSKVTAGQVLGTTGSAYAIDLGVWNDSLTLGFLSPTRYIPDTLHADAPLKYFDEPVRSQLYSKVQRLGSDLDGKIDFDVPGRLVGNWFIGAADSFPLVFVYDTYDPAKVLIAVGDSSGVFSIAPTDPQPKDVSVATGKVLYTLSNSSSGFHPTHTTGVVGHMLVQMIDDTHVKEEAFFLSIFPTDFTGNARIFSR